MQTQTHGFRSPLRYPGGKGMLANFIKLILSANNLLDGHYVEVYAGGAGIAWSLLFEEYVRHIHINDLNSSLYAFWRSVLDHPEEMCRRIYDTPITMEEWHRQKAIQAAPSNHSLIELGFSTFFLNRTNRSGIISGGVIGGKEQTGKWKLDARFNRKDLTARIQKIARYSKRISLYNQDATDFLLNVLPKLPDKTLVYLDPPYYVKGQDLYENAYNHGDHLQIEDMVETSIRQPWIVSYDAAPEIMLLYSKFRSIQYHLSYSAQERYAGSEVMFFSPRLVVPTIHHPAKVKPGPQMSFII
jgi:DNA adenine methylase